MSTPKPWRNTKLATIMWLALICFKRIQRKKKGYGEKISLKRTLIPGSNSIFKREKNYKRRQFIVVGLLYFAGNGEKRREEGDRENGGDSTFIFSVYYSWPLYTYIGLKNYNPTLTIIPIIQSIILLWLTSVCSSQP